MPATIIAVLFSARPAAAADNPVIALSSEMTTGMSAPPIGNTTNRPMIPASTSTTTINQPGLPCPGRHAARCRPPRRPRRAAAPRWRPETAWRSCTSAFSTFFGIDSCSLRNATSEPQNDTEPMTAANSDPTTSATVGDCSGSKWREAVGLDELRPRDQRDRAAADAVEQRDQLRHRGHLGLLGRRHAEDHADRQTGGDQDPVDRGGVAHLDQRRDDGEAHTGGGDPVAAHRGLGPGQPDRPRMNSANATM